MNSKELKGLCEAYQQVNAPQQITEETSEILSAEISDTFDVIKGHLIDEGYAETEEAALAIMANMSEEWRQSIVEAIGGPIGNALKAYSNATRPLFKGLPQGKTQTTPQPKPNPSSGSGIGGAIKSGLKAYSNATKPLFSGLPKGTFTTKDNAFKAGGGNAKMKATGMGRSEVEKLGVKNLRNQP